MIEMTCKDTEASTAPTLTARNRIYQRSIQYPARYSLRIKDTDCGEKMF
jgi:hypothetical protein